MKLNTYILLVLILCSCQSQVDSRRNGDLDSTFIQSPNSVFKTTNTDSGLIFLKQQLIQDGWSEEKLENGQFVACYNFTPRKEDIDNFLEIKVGSGTDVAVKLMNIATETCFRYIFINSGTNYTLTGIPEGKYYLKIAYGKNWFSKVNNGKCIGKFIKNPFYTKGDEILDFEIKRTSNGYKIPSFRLELDVISNNPEGTFSSVNISQEEFDN